MVAGKSPNVHEFWVLDNTAEPDLDSVGLQRGREDYRLLVQAFAGWVRQIRDYVVDKQRSSPSMA
ncbi:hypothetical protein M2302_003323 [Micromonospora sp. A200]|nr:hypothetical protein [Micromonospora sp. A200]